MMANDFLDLFSSLQFVLFKGFVDETRKDEKTSM